MSLTDNCVRCRPEWDGASEVGLCVGLVERSWFLVRAGWPVGQHSHEGSERARGTARPKRRKGGD